MGGQVRDVLPRRARAPASPGAEVPGLNLISPLKGAEYGGVGTEPSIVLQPASASLSGSARGPQPRATRRIVPIWNDVPSLSFHEPAHRKRESRHDDSHPPLTIHRPALYPGCRLDDDLRGVRPPPHLSNLRGREDGDEERRLPDLAA